MSVLIRGMEMPKHGDVLVVREYNEKTYIKHEGHLGFEATLSKIPTPHGRLIDADALANTLRDVSKRQKYDKLFSDNVLSVGDVFDAIIADLEGTGTNGYKLIPTVIEAEGRGE